MHSTFTAATFCCLDADDLSAPSKTGDAPIMHSLNTSAVKDLLTRIRRHHLGRAYSSPLRPIAPLRLPLLAASASSSPRIALIERALLPRRPQQCRPRPPIPTGCERTPLARLQTPHSCSWIARSTSARAAFARFKPPPLEPFAAALETLASTHVLIGMHGAGLVNAVFLPPGATVVEIFPRRFSAPGSFGWEKHTWLRQLGLRRLRMLADEVSLQGCVSPEERKARVWARMRDCDVTVSWRDVERALSRPDPISTTYMPFEGGQATDEQLTRRDIESEPGMRESPERHGARGLCPCTRRTSRWRSGSSPTLSFRWSRSSPTLSFRTHLGSRSRLPLAARSSGRASASRQRPSCSHASMRITGSFMQSSSARWARSRA